MRREVLLTPRGGRFEVDVPTTRRERMRGFLGRGRLRASEALLLERARSIHTFGMRITITVAFLDTELTVCRVRRMPPRRFALPRPGVRHVLECAEGADLRVGDRLMPEGPPRDPWAGFRRSRSARWSR